MDVCVCLCECLVMECSWNTHTHTQPNITELQAIFRTLSPGSRGVSPMPKKPSSLGLASLGFRAAMWAGL